MQPATRQPPDAPSRPLQLALPQPPYRTTVARRIAQRLPTRPVVAVGQRRELAQPMTQGIALTRLRQADQRRQYQGWQAQPLELPPLSRLLQIDKRQLIQQLPGLAHMRCAARQAAGSLWPAGSQQWEHLMAQVITGELPILVGGVVDPVQLVITSVTFQFVAGDVEQRPQQMPPPQGTRCRNGGQAPDPGPTQQTKQQGFRLIVTVLGRQQQLIAAGYLFERGITRLPRRTLQAGPRLHLHRHYLQRHRQGLALGSTMLRPGVSHSLKAVMHMDGGQRGKCVSLPELGKQVQQDGGIEATGERDAPSRSIQPGQEALQQFLRKDGIEWAHEWTGS
ncbi:hypothetical protein EMIT0373P_50449 [Pseudomonas chlororaphis]